MFSVASKYLPEFVLQKCTAAYFKVSTWRNLGIGNKAHSQSAVESLQKMKVKILPALSDNYMYLIIDEATKEAAVIDPVQPDDVIAAVQEEGVNLTKILTTHHHWDHAGGNEGLVKKVANLQVYGGDDRIGALTNKVKMNDIIKIGSLNVRCLFTPCHTTGHICYLVEENTTSASVFTGDTLFIGGCGRFFEGTADQMNNALMDILGGLSDDTKVFCGHEYTLANLAFCKNVEPENQDIEKRITWAKELRNRGVPTVPSTIKDEKLTNPFMRVNQESVKKHTNQNEPVLVMKALREEKDNFKAN